MRPCRAPRSERQAAEAVRARIDWPYLLGVALTDPGCDHAVVCAVRDRVFAGHAAARWRDTLRARCRACGGRKAGGTQRPAAPQVVAAIRGRNRRAWVADTRRAARTDLAGEAPQGRRPLAPPAWSRRSRRRLAERRFPQRQAARDADAQTGGAAGLCVVDAVAAPETPQGRGALPSLATRRQVWQEHDARLPDGGPSRPQGTARRVRCKPARELPTAAQKSASPDEAEARSRHTRATQWTGDLVHVTEPCEPEAVPLLPHVAPTTAAGHDAPRPETSAAALLANDLAPGQPLVEAASMDAALLVTRRDTRGIAWRGPPRPNTRGHTRLAGAYTRAPCTGDWGPQPVQWPQGTASRSWQKKPLASGGEASRVRCAMAAGGGCERRAWCPHATKRPRGLQLPPQEQYEALQAARAWATRDQGQHLYARRAGMEGTLSQGGRAYGRRRSRSRGFATTHVPQVATAVAIHGERSVAWRDDRPQATTRTARCAALQPKAA